MPECPVCGEEFKASGMHPHLRSHDKNELAAVVSKVAKTDENTTLTQGAKEDPVWHRIKTQKIEVMHERNKRNRKVNQHLKELDAQIRETLR